jgi:hypothetical protein
MDKIKWIVETKLDVVDKELTVWGIFNYFLINESTQISWRDRKNIEIKVRKE